jgi:outer membrane autotransporter protein
VAEGSGQALALRGGVAAAVFALGLALSGGSAGSASLTIPTGGTNNTNFPNLTSDLIVTVNAGIGKMTGSVIALPPKRFGLVKRGNGTLAIQGGAPLHNYRGDTVIEDGRLIALNDFVLSPFSSFAVNKGAVFEVGGNVFVDIGSLKDGPDGAGKVIIGRNDPITLLGIGGDNRTTVFSGSITGQGSLEKFGAGTQVLTGNSIIGGDLTLCIGCTGGIEIRGGSFGVGGAINIDQGTLSVTQGGTVVQRDPFSGILVGQRLNVDGKGSSVTSFGATIVEASISNASLRITNGAVVNSIGGAAVLGAGFNANATVSGTGSVWNVNQVLFVSCACGPAGVVVTNGGVVNSRGLTLFDIGSLLRIGTGGAAGTFNAGLMLLNGTIFANFTDTSILRARLFGMGRIIKAGRGELILTGRSELTGPTTIRGGLLTINGANGDSPITINPNGTLGGVGLAGQANVFGAIAPGNSVGTLRMAGSVTFRAGSRFHIEVSNAADRLIVVPRGGVGPGNAVLTGGRVLPTYLSGGVLKRQYLILDARGGLGGTRFAGLGATPPGIVATLSYARDDVFLNHTVAFGRIAGLTRNQKAVAQVLDAQFAKNGTLPTDLAAFDLPGLSGAAGEIALAAASAGIHAADGFLNMIFSLPANSGGPAAPLSYADGDQPDATANSAQTFARLLRRSSAHAADDVDAVFDNRWQVWGGAYGGVMEIEGDPVVIGSASVDPRSFGIAGGVAHPFGNGTIGLALGAGTSNFDLSGGRGSGEAGTFNAGLALNQSFGDFYAAGALAYGFHDVETSRIVAGSAISGDFGAHTFSARAETGYRFETSVATIAPYAALQAIAYRLPAYAEAGGPAALAYAAGTTTATRIELGARLEHHLTLGSTAVKLTGRAAWAINGGTSQRAVAAFQSIPGATFTVDGAAPARHSALIDAGAEFDLGRGLTAALALQGEFSSNVESFGAKGSFTYRW